MRPKVPYVWRKPEWLNFRDDLDVADSTKRWIDYPPGAMQISIGPGSDVDQVIVKPHNGPPGGLLVSVGCPSPVGEWHSPFEVFPSHNIGRGGIGVQLGASPHTLFAAALELVLHPEPMRFDAAFRPPRVRQSDRPCFDPQEVTEVELVVPAVEDVIAEIPTFGRRTTTLFLRNAGESPGTDIEFRVHAANRTTSTLAECPQIFPAPAVPTSMQELGDGPLVLPLTTQDYAYLIIVAQSDDENVLHLAYETRDGR